MHSVQYSAYRAIREMEVLKGPFNMTKLAFKYFLFLTTALMLSACDRNSKERRSPDMSEFTPRFQSIFERVKTVCFGRFMVDMPASADVVWGESLVPLAVEVYPRGINHVKELEQKFISNLNSEKAINHNYVPLLISVDDMAQPEGMLVTGYEGFEAINGLQINGYIRLDSAGVVISSHPLRDDKDETISLIRSIAKRLRMRPETEVPLDPGSCIEYAFLKDAPNTTPEDLLEHIRIGIRLKEIPDAHISVYIAPANFYDPQSDSLERQFKRIFADMTSPEEKRILENTKIFRRTPRQIHDWKTGFEILMRSPDEEGSLSHHDFRMKFVGVPHDPYRPYADIQFQTGVSNNAAGATKATLTDEEALALWDKITSTIRVRPTRVIGEKSAAMGSAARLPLGEYAATGRICPQTGIWEPTEPAGMEGGRRQHIKGGERMPHVTLQTEPSVWQKLKGERSAYRTGTVWKLVAYDIDASVTPDAAVSMPVPAPYGSTSVATHESEHCAEEGRAIPQSRSKKES